VTRRVATVALVVRDYDEAIAWFTRALGFVVLEDTPLGGEKRWVLVAPAAPVAPAAGAAGGAGGAALLLARAAKPEQTARVGDQTGGRVFLFLETDDFARDHAAMSAEGVRFVEGPREESYGRVAVFLDLYGNRWDLVERTSAPDATRS
jgi:catechol 2,3-dioxygenase-like lactoylglutathione lyase family enzyme